MRGSSGEMGRGWDGTGRREGHKGVWRRNKVKVGAGVRSERRLLVGDTRIV